MRSRTMSFTLVLTGVVLAAPVLAAPCSCGTSKAGQGAGHDHGQHGNAVTAAAPAAIQPDAASTASSEAWGTALSEYEAIHAALAADSVAGVTAAAARLAAVAEEATAQATTAEEAAELRAVAEAARGLSGNDLDALRQGFRPLSQQLGESAARLRTLGVDLYYCSMAPGYWLQRGDIANPYYGKEMSRCGERVGAVAPAGK